ncbi:polysaccharide deacetylase family protein [Neptunicella marina]|uniref:Polysaccharide deacetylase family protein n=1 Tax=Neptunicella marina TaxID=2125989 RepID=A0A8J6IUB2_9ALTE|nr:polysaccharide deacetylase family protein [Neptunicella marina]MBC3765927.1 polysaccharide deacetylase family protein [Neptunicella marina]
MCSINAMAQSGVILVYHHVSSETPASTSVTVEQFRQHLNLIKQHYTVWPLDKMVKALKQNNLPANTLAITFDDGYIDILQNAHPMLQEYQFPYTVFVNPDQIGVRANQLTWQQIKQMSQQNVLFANHTNEHVHLLQKQQDETDEQWFSRITRNIQRAESSLQQQLGYSLKYVAYPYGEYNQQIQQWMTDNGYVGFGQQSGAVAAYSDFSALPRFPSAGIYANLKTLQVKMASLAMPVTSINLADTEFKAGEKYPLIKVQVDLSDMRNSGLSCFQDSEALDVSWNKQQFTIQPKGNIPAGRSRINCTVPSNSLSGRYYWYSIPFFAADNNGNWLD